MADLWSLLTLLSDHHPDKFGAPIRQILHKRQKVQYGSPSTLAVRKSRFSFHDLEGESV
jgi:hypothetical protein